MRFSPVTLTLTRQTSYANLTRIPRRYHYRPKMNFLCQKLSKFIVFKKRGATFLTHSVQTEIITAPFREC